MYMLLSSEETLYQVSTHAFSAKGRAEQISAELFYPTKKTLLKKQAQEQTGYITTAAQAAYASLNKLDWTKTFYGYVELTPNTQDSINFDGNSSGLGYALALALEWRKQLNKPTDYEAEAFATGEIHSSGAVTEIGHLETKITAACNFMENKNAVTQTQQPFVIFYPNANQDDVTPELQTRVAAIGGKLCPVERLQSALTILLGDAYDGDSEGRWEPFKGLLSFNYEDSLRFFGRERALTKLNKEFNEAEGLLVVTGVSGSGKSSLTKAGLIPQINKELPEGNTLDWLISTPKAHNSVESMLVELLNTLDKHWSIRTNSKDNSDKGESDADKDSGLDALSKEAIQSPDTFIAAIKQAQLLQPNKRIFYYIDQYEDIFNHQDISREQAQQLTPLLAQLAKQIPNLDIVISIRSEYEDILGKYGSVSHVNPELNASEWGDIVYKQATSFGLRYEEGLEKRIVNEASGIQHALPALEYLLEQLYKKAKKADESARLLTHEHYEQLNGIRGVIAARAEEAIALHLDQADAFFEYFVGLNDEGMPCTKSVSLTLIEKENHSLYQLVQTFIAERLVVDCSTKQNDSQQEKRVKLAHDTLLSFESEESCWQRLKTWFENNHDYLVLFKQIMPDLKRWISIQDATKNTLEVEISSANSSDSFTEISTEDSVKDNIKLSQEFLLNKLDLKQAQHIQQNNQINNPLVLSYIQASQQFYQAQLELEAARLVRESKAQKKRFIVVTILLIISIISGGFAYIKEQEIKLEVVKTRSALDNIRVNLDLLLFEQGDFIQNSGSMVLRDKVSKAVAESITIIKNLDGASDVGHRSVVYSSIMKARLMMDSTQGDLDGSLSLLKDSLKVISVSLAKNPSNQIAIHDYWKVHSLLGEVFLRLGHVDKAKKHYEAAQTKLNLFFETDSILNVDLVVSYLNLGHVLIDTGQFNSAKFTFQSALDLSLNLIDGYTEPPLPFSRIVAQSYIGKGDALSKLGDETVALEAYRKAEIRIKAARRENQGNPSLGQDLVMVYQRIGNSLKRQGDLTESIELFEKKLKISESLVLANPTDMIVNLGLQKSRMKVGDAYHQLGNVKAAQELFKYAQEDVRKMLLVNPKEIVLQIIEKMLVSKLADIELSRGNIDVAMSSYESALSFFKTLELHEPYSLDNKEYIINALHKTFEIYVLKGHYKLALKSIKQKKLKVDEALKISSNSLRILNFSYETNHTLGNLQLFLNQPEKAVVSWLNSISELDKLLIMSPNNTELLKQRLILIKKTSGLYLSTGEYGLVEDLLAKIEYEQALILKADNYIIQKLTAQLYKIEGSLKLAREKYVEAIEIYSKSNKILDKLFSEEPNDLEVAKVIFGNHMNIGFVYLRLKKADVALHSFKNGESIISKIQATIPDEPELSEMKLQLNKNLFDFYLNASQLGTALKIIDESLALFTSHESAISDDVFYSHIVNAAGVSYSLGKYQKAANYYTIYFKKIGIYNIANTTNKKELLTNRSIAYVQWAWLNLLAGKYDEVKDKLKVLVGYLSLEDKNRLLINANLAHAYLLSGEYKRAYDIYKLNMNTQVNKTQTFKDAVIADFDKLRSNNITHPQMEYIEKELLSLLKPLDSN